MNKILKRYSNQNRNKINHQISYLFLFSTGHMKKFINLLFISLSTIFVTWLTSSSAIVFSNESYFLNQTMLFLTEIFCAGLSIVLISFASRKVIFIASQWVFLHISLLLLLSNSLYNLNPENFVCRYLLQPFIYFFFIFIKVMGFSSLISIFLYICESFPSFLRTLVLAICIGFGKLSILFLIPNKRIILPRSIEGFDLLALCSLLGFTLAFILGDSRTNGMLN